MLNRKNKEQRGWAIDPLFFVFSPYFYTQTNFNRQAKKSKMKFKIPFILAFYLAFFI